MKKTVSIILALALAFSLCACGNLSNIELPPLPTVDVTDQDALHALEQAITAAALSSR